MMMSLVNKLRVYVMRRRQFDSAPLRRYFEEKHDIKVGFYSYGCFDEWRMPGPMRVGRYCSIANTVRSALINHPIDALTTHPVLYERKFGVVDKDIVREVPLVIEDDVWIAHNVVILPGCKFVGRGAVIGAGSIVTQDVPRYSVMVGNPARKLRDRFDPELIEALEASCWWEMDLAQLRELLTEREGLVRRPTVEELESWMRERASVGRRGSGARPEEGGTKA